MKERNMISKQQKGRIYKLGKHLPRRNVRNGITLIKKKENSNKYGGNFKKMHKMSLLYFLKLETKFTN